MKSMAAQSIQCSAPAKINLSLAVLGRRDDGFHEIESWVTPIDWSDRLTFEPGMELSLRLAGPASAPEGPSNLVWQAAAKLARAAGVRPEVRITLHKYVPAGAGLGGGSSDAAAALLALNDFWCLDWAVERLWPIAEELGSDVPLFLAPGPAIIRGRGGRIEPLSRPAAVWLGLVVPSFAVSTSRVYEAWSTQAGEGRRPCPWLKEAEGAALMPELFNDLEPAAFVVEPRLARLHARIDGFAGRPVRMTGSGSALFTLFDDEPAARAWAKGLGGLIGSEAEVHVVRSLPSFRPPPMVVEDFPE